MRILSRAIRTSPILAVVLMSAIYPASAQSRYKVEILSIPDSTVAGTAMNNVGQIAGNVWSNSNPADVRGFIYTRGNYTFFPAFGSAYIEVSAINDLGQVVGTFRNANHQYRAFLYSDGITRDLGTMDGNSSYGHDLNNAGEVVGYVYGPIANSSHRGFIYTGGLMRRVPAIDYNYSILNAITDHGVFVGHSAVPPSQDRAFMGTLNGPAIDLGTLGRASDAFDINNHDEVAGYARLSSDNQQRAVLVQNGTMINLGTLGGFWSGASSINNLGQMVGTSDRNRNNHPFLYSGGVMHDITEWLYAGPGYFRPGGASKINDQGQMIGLTTRWEDGKTVWWVATPNFPVTVTPRNATIGESITVSWTAPAGRPATDWIGLYRPGAHNEHYLWYAYTGGATEGTFTLAAPGPAGVYEFRYFVDNSYRDMGLSNPLTTTVLPGYSVSPNLLTALPGQTITAGWKSPTGSSATDWIGVYRIGADNRQFHSWGYTGGAASGSLSLAAPMQDGEYEVRYLLNDGYEDVARSIRFRVSSAGFSVTAAPLTVSRGGTATVRWFAPHGSLRTNWIGLYREGEKDNKQYAWPHWFYVDGLTNGIRDVKMPATPGRYVFRYLLDNGYTHVAESAVVTIH